MKARARLITGGVCVSARGVPGIAARAMLTDKTGVSRYLRVTPTEPQILVWLVPQYGVDYQVASNTDWNIK